MSVSICNVQCLKVPVQTCSQLLPTSHPSPPLTDKVYYMLDGKHLALADVKGFA